MNDYAVIETPKGTAAEVSMDHEAKKTASTYRAIFCGNSAKDLILIPCLFILFYAVVSGYFALLLYACVQTTSTSAALWIYFTLFMIGVMALSFFLNVAKKPIDQPLNGPEEQRQANEYLIAVADSNAAWNVGLSLLQHVHTSHATPIQYFAANMIYSKLRKEYNVLSTPEQQSIQSELDSIIQQVRQGQLSLAPLVLQRLCMAASVIYLSTDGGCAKCVNACVSSPTSEIAIVVALELLTSLCDENTDSYLPIARKDSLVLEITDISSTVFSFLGQLFPQIASVADARYAALVCLKAWIKGAGFSIAKLYSTLGHIFNSLLQAIQTISQDATVTREVVVCASILCNALEVNEYPPAAAKEDAVLALVNGILAGEAAILHYLKNDENVALALTTLIAAFGEAELEWVIEGNPQALALAELMLKMTSQPNRQIASLLLDFWLAVQEEPVVDRHEAFRDAIFRRLVHVLLVQCSAQPDEDEDDESSFSSFRSTVVDVLLSIYCLLKDEYLRFVAQIVQSNTNNLALVESAFFLLSTITCDLKPRLQSPQGRVSQEILRALCTDYVFGHAAFTTSASLIQVASMLLGQLNGWLALKGNETLLATSVQYLTSATGLPSSAKVASKSLLQIACACTETLATMSDMVLLIIKALHSHTLDVSDRVVLTEAIVRVATTASWCMDALNYLVAPIIQRLSNTTLHETPPAIVIADLTCLTTLLRFADAPSASAGGANVTNQLIITFYPMLVPLASLFGSSEAMMDVIFEFIAAIFKAKRGTKEEIAAFGSTAEVMALLELIVGIFDKYSYPSAFSPATVAIEIFGHNAPKALYQCFAALSQKTFQMCQTNSPSDIPDTIRGCFEMSQRCVMFCPMLLFESEFAITMQLAVAALVGLRSHREGLRSVIFFLNHVITKRETTLIQYKQQIDAVLGGLKEMLCDAVITLLGSSCPTTLYAPVSSLWFHILTVYGALIYPVMQHALVTSSATQTLSMTDKEHVYKAWISLSENYQERRFNSMCLDVAKVCRREMTPDVLVEYLV
ncbi:hypothetical protein THRCLA_11407 [Thraustotheca clavata]|uniref:Transportin-3 n=1 Tax=Thraustotheca clavata TaxID=74557 RepID=A0A1V9Y7U4_9STRA|nr:hypothetical protein THRCLA_11407 [Thraustotheca clavata]